MDWGARSKQSNKMLNSAVGILSPFWQSDSRTVGLGKLLVTRERAILK